MKFAVNVALIQIRLGNIIEAVRSAMDDFGTGYASLNDLRRFEFDKFKIDQTFIAGLGQSTEADCIIHAVIDLGASLCMTSNAEGVATLDQTRKLKQQGGKEVQGYFFRQANALGQHPGAFG